MMEEKIEETVECCENEAVDVMTEEDPSPVHSLSSLVHPKHRKRLSDEEILNNYKEQLKLELEEELRDFELSKKKDELKKEFMNEHASDYKKLEEFKREHYREESVFRSDLYDEKIKWLSESDIEELRKKYKALEEREKEILEISTDPVRIPEFAEGQLTALIDEYQASEKLKLIIVDRIKSNIAKKDIRLSAKYFGNSHCYTECEKEHPYC